MVRDFSAGPTGAFGPDAALLQKFLDAQAEDLIISFKLWLP